MKYLKITNEEKYYIYRLLEQMKTGTAIYLEINNNKTIHIKKVKVN